MAEITVSEVTNSDNAVDGGTGIFDKLMVALNQHIDVQYDKGRINGKDYAQVYLGMVQAALSESINFALGKQQADKQAELLTQQVLSEIKNNEDGGLIDLQKEKLLEEIDLVVANTAETYEGIEASQATTLRNDSLNDKKIIQTEAETVEIVANTGRQDDMLAKQLEKLDEEIDLLQSRDLEQIASTLRQNNESTKKILLIEAQTTGFSSDTKTKVLRQLSEGYSVGLSIAGVGVLPDAYGDLTINNLTENILDEIGATGIIVPRTPDPIP